MGLVSLGNQLRHWAAAVEVQLGISTEGAEEALAHDGKTLRGALKLEVTATVTALGHRLSLTAGAAEVPKGDEIAAVEALLEKLVLVGNVVTRDALHTQRRRACQRDSKTGSPALLVIGAKTWHSGPREREAWPHVTR